VLPDRGVPGSLTRLIIHVKRLPEIILESAAMIGFVRS
jgi:hypothetical protein